MQLNCTKVNRVVPPLISLLQINSRHLLQEKLLPQFWSHFDSNKVQSSFETLTLLLVLQVVSRGVSDSLNYTNYERNEDIVST